MHYKKTFLSTYILLLIVYNAECSHWFKLNTGTKSPTKQEHEDRPHNHSNEEDFERVFHDTEISQIDLNSWDGINFVTKLILHKTNSLQKEATVTKADSRYLNDLMDKLYTGMRKPFKSVPADFLGIFPTFEEVQVKCDSLYSQDFEETSIIINSENNTIRPSDRIMLPLLNISSIEKTNDTLDRAIDSTTLITNRSALRVCKSVTSDCLPLDELVQLLPDNARSFPKALVRLCPVMLFRIMNRICQRQKYLSENKPQRLHKKLKIPPSANKPNPMNSKKDGVAEERFLKVRLKLTEPSIEKVWIFSLLFVILSIVVSMGGLIVLPFVKKTTRRRILTLFEGLAVGGLAGSATLHMFPQAFGLLDENYHKYFWRIFVVFFGIYICYLCERIIKIVKVARFKSRKRDQSVLNTFNFGQEFRNVKRLKDERRLRRKSKNSLTNVKEMSRRRESDMESGSTNIPVINNPSKDRVIQCLKSVRQQFSPVYPVDQETDMVVNSRLSSRRGIKHDHGRSRQAWGFINSNRHLTQDDEVGRQDHDHATKMSEDTVAWMIIFGDAVLNVIDGLSIGAAFERNILAGISVSVAVMLEEVTHRLGTFAVLIRAGMSMKQSLLCTFLSACAMFPGLIVGIVLSDATEDATPYILCAAGGIFLYMVSLDLIQPLATVMIKI